MSMHDGVVEGGLHISRAALLERASRAASALASVGVNEGGRIALLLHNSAAVFDATFGAATLGAATVPLNWHSTEEEICYLLQDSVALVLIADDDLLTEGLRRRAEACLILPLSRWRGMVAAHPPWDAPSRGAASPMFYTSGTTGRPKGVLRGQAGDRAATAERDLHCFGLGQPAMRSVMIGPLYHSAPNAYAMMLIESGGLLVLRSKFDAADLLADIEQYRITNLHLVPTMFVRLLALDPATQRRHDLSSLRHVVHGAAPCPPDVKRAMIEWWGPVIHEYYAMTETGFIACSTSEEWIARPNSVGRAAPGVTIEIRDEDGRTCAPGEAGEIHVRIEAAAPVGYHGDPAKSAALYDGAFLRTGDEGCLDCEGFLSISGRKSDVVISGGVNIYPAEIEHSLLAIEGVRDCAVFGIPDRDYGESLVAAIELGSGVAEDADRVIAQLRRRISGYKIPRIIRFVPAIPREETGKIKKHRLRADLFPVPPG